jgi:hypothetical protein
MSNDPSMDQFWKDVRRPGSPFLGGDWRRQPIDYGSVNSSPMNPLAPPDPFPAGVPMPDMHEAARYMAAHRAFWSRVAGL